MVLERVGEVASKFAHSPSLSIVHLVFHVSLMMGYRTDQSHWISYKELQLRFDLSYEEEIMQILDSCSKTLCLKVVSLAKVL